MPKPLVREALVRIRYRRQKIAHRAPRGAVCLITALARHGLTDMIPPRIDIAFPRGSRVPTLRKSIDVHVFARETRSEHVNLIEFIIP